MPNIKIRRPDESNWSAYERSAGRAFVAWASDPLGEYSSTRYAIVQPLPGSGLEWVRLHCGDPLPGQCPQETRRSAGAFYDTGDPGDHPEGAVEWARSSARAHAERWERLAR
jgi:hypothetical protein